MKERIARRIMSKWFPKTLDRIETMHMLIDRIQMIERKCRIFGQTSHGKTGLNLAEEHARLSSQYEAVKYPWMPHIVPLIRETAKIGSESEEVYDGTIDVDSATARMLNDREERRYATKDTDGRSFAD